MSISSSEAVICVRRVVAEALGDLGELLLDEPEDALLVAEDRRAARAIRSVTSACSCLIVVGLERGQLRQAQVEDRLGLDDATARSARSGRSRAASRSREARISVDDRVEVVDAR